MSDEEIQNKILSDFNNISDEEFKKNYTGPNVGRFWAKFRGLDGDLVQHILTLIPDERRKFVMDTALATLRKDRKKAADNREENIKSELERLAKEQQAAQKQWEKNTLYAAAEAGDVVSGIRDVTNARDSLINPKRYKYFKSPFSMLLTLTDEKELKIINKLFTFSREFIMPYYIKVAAVKRVNDAIKEFFAFNPNIRTDSAECTGVSFLLNDAVLGSNKRSDINIGTKFLSNGMLNRIHQIVITIKFGGDNGFIPVKFNGWDLWNSISDKLILPMDDEQNLNRLGREVYLSKFKHDLNSAVERFISGGEYSHTNNDVIKAVVRGFNELLGRNKSFRRNKYGGLAVIDDIIRMVEQSFDSETLNSPISDDFISRFMNSALSFLMSENSNYDTEKLTTNIYARINKLKTDVTSGGGKTVGDVLKFINSQLTMYLSKSDYKPEDATIKYKYSEKTLAKPAKEDPESVEHIKGMATEIIKGVMSYIGVPTLDRDLKEKQIASGEESIDTTTVYYSVDFRTLKFLIRRSAKYVGGKSDAQRSKK